MNFVDNPTHGHVVISGVGYPSSSSVSPISDSGDPGYQQSGSAYRSPSGRTDQVSAYTVDKLRKKSENIKHVLPQKVASNQLHRNPTQLNIPPPTNPPHPIITFHSGHITRTPGRLIQQIIY